MTMHLPDSISQHPFLLSTSLIVWTSASQNARLRWVDAAKLMNGEYLENKTVKFCGAKIELAMEFRQVPHHAVQKKGSIYLIWNIPSMVTSPGYRTTGSRHSLSPWATFN